MILECSNQEIKIKKNSSHRKGLPTQVTFVINKPKHAKLLFFLHPTLRDMKSGVPFNAAAWRPSFFVHIRISPPTPIDVAEDVKKWREQQRHWQPNGFHREPESLIAQQPAVVGHCHSKWPASSVPQFPSSTAHKIREITQIRWRGVKPHGAHYTTDNYL